MPHIGAAMARSLGEERGLTGAMADLVVRSVAAGLVKRQGTITNTASNVKGGITDVKTAFSSWDNCMQASFCKWPVIAVIIIGGLIIFSIVWCLARCLCCGLSCCCSCFRCLKCCGNCCGCCDGPEKRHKYLDEPYIPTHNDQGQGYRSQAPMSAGAIATTPSLPAKNEPPHYAVFDDSKKRMTVGGDKLPEMPSWESAGSQKVLIEEEVEMEPLKKPEAAQDIPLMSHGAMSPNPASPAGNSPYGVPGHNVSTGYMAANIATDPYAANAAGQGYNNYSNGSYGQISRDDGNQGYGMAAAGAAGAMGTMGQGRGGYGQRSYDDYGRSGTPGAYGMGPQRTGTPGNGGYGIGPQRTGTPGSGYGPPRGATPQGGPYGAPNRMQSPAPVRQFSADTQSPGPYGVSNRMQSPAPVRQYTTDSQSSGPYGGPNRMQSPAPIRQYSADTQGAVPYGAPNRLQSPAPAPQRQYSADNYGYDQRSQVPNSYGRQYPPTPQRQYSKTTQPSTRTTPDRQYSESQYTDVSQSPIQNSGGFDFSSGYSRAETSSPGPGRAANGGTAYPGYKAYKPAS